jgi:membrane protein YqaA with SNARE-associated domain
MWLINNVSSPEQFAHAQGLFAKYGTLIIVLAAVTPVPYKVMAICAGFLSFPAWIFIGVSAIFRTARFAIVGYLLYRFQGTANKIVQKYFWPLTIGAALAAGFGIFLLWVI